MRDSDEELLKRAPDLRWETGVGISAIARALGIDRSRLYRWEKGVKPRNRVLLTRYLRVLRGLERHCEIEETWYER